VVFRYKQTDSDAHRRITPRWRGCQPRAGLSRSVARDLQPAPGCPKTHGTLPRLHRAHGPQPQRTRPRSCSRAAGDGPEATVRVSLPTVCTAVRKHEWIKQAGYGVEPAGSATYWPQSAQRTSYPPRGSADPLVPLTRTKPASAKRQRRASDTDQPDNAR
jgi:hypothetical protein